MAGVRVGMNIGSGFSGGLRLLLGLSSEAQRYLPNTA